VYKASLVDAIFTRIGAQDRILDNKSTFFVELEETKEILDKATDKSLVIVDELGRGTSTFDGYALAHAVLQYLAFKQKCLTMFTTHYRWLVRDFEKHQEVGVYTMAVEKRKTSEGLGETSEALAETAGGKKDRTVKFLYKFVKGVAESSFGLGVA